MGLDREPRENNGVDVLLPGTGDRREVAEVCHFARYEDGGNEEGKAKGPRHSSQGQIRSAHRGLEATGRRDGTM